MLVLVLGIADHLLVGRGSNSHDDSFLCGPARALGLADVPARGLALRRRGLSARLDLFSAATRPALGVCCAQRARRMRDLVVLRDLDAVLTRRGGDLASRALLIGRRLEGGLIP